MAATLAVRAGIAGRRARLVSLDGVGLGAAGFLEVVAEASGVSCALATTAEELIAALAEPGAGLTVIDTPGVNPRDPDAVAALAALLRVAQPDQVHLIVPATTKSEDAVAAVAGLAGLAPTHVAFSRLDEAATLGSLLSVCATGELPVSYLAAGRDIPNDLTPATARGLARRVLGGEPER
jgi:flagellar biosynthesis protein FlhF